MGKPLVFLVVLLFHSSIITHLILLELKKIATILKFTGRHSSVVERLVANEKVEGSSPLPLHRL